MDFNREYDPDTEAAIGIPPIKEIPHFSPSIPADQMEHLINMDEKLHPLAIATHKALSIAEQRGNWRDGVMVHLVGSVREMRREQIQNRKTKTNWLNKLIEIVITAALSALALWWLKAL